MALTHSDIAALAKGMAPAIKDQIAKATAPLHARISAIEGKSGQREIISRPVDDDAARRAIEGEASE